jgi:hypothetical protein
MEYEQFIRDEFNILQSAGKEKTNLFLKEVEDYIKDLEQPDLIENRMKDILKQVRIDKKLSYTQYKELYPFVVSARKLMAAKQPEDYFILL